MRIILSLLALIFLLAAVVTALVLASPRDTLVPETLPEATTVPELRSESGTFSIEPDLDIPLSASIATVVSSPVPSFVPSASACPPTATAEPIIIEVFDDFLCPYCARHFVDALQPIAHSDEFREQPIEYRFFTLPIHGDASATLAKAAKCAEGQVDVWEFRAKLYAAPDKTVAIAGDLLEELGGKRTDFEACFESQVAEDELQAAIAYAKKLEIEATPTLRIDDELMVGMVPQENIAHIIRKKLAALPQKSLECGR